MDTTGQATRSSLLVAHTTVVIRHILSMLKRLRFSAYSRYRRHPIASISGCCTIVILALLIGLLFGTLSSSEDVHTTEIVREAAVNQSGVSSFRTTVIQGLHIADSDFAVRELSLSR
jgi:hypothetical protein